MVAFAYQKLLNTRLKVNLVVDLKDLYTLLSTQQKALEDQFDMILPVIGTSSRLEAWMSFRE